jgi:hypothetical protein
MQKDTAAAVSNDMERAHRAGLERHKRGKDPPPSPGWRWNEPTASVSNDRRQKGVIAGVLNDTNA